jgi:hypothetical protein
MRRLLRACAAVVVATAVSYRSIGENGLVALDDELPSSTIRRRVELARHAVPGVFHGLR